jgi:hypothetical protein
VRGLPCGPHDVIYWGVSGKSVPRIAVVRGPRPGVEMSHLLKIKGAGEARVPFLFKPAAPAGGPQQQGAGGREGGSCCEDWWWLFPIHRHPWWWLSQAGPVTRLTVGINVG